MCIRDRQTCSACVCYNDEIAHLVTEQCIQAGIRIPDDLSLVSVDNSELAKLNAVPLTSVTVSYTHLVTYMISQLSCVCIGI